MISAQLMAMVDAGALVAVSHSGGKDSQAMLIALSATVPREQMIVVHASLGDMEWPGTLELAQHQAECLGLPFLVARAGKTLLGMVERRYATRPEVPSWPSPGTRQCTSDLKRGPIRREVGRYARERGYKTIINCMGLRAEESSARAKRPTLQRIESASSGRRDWWDWLPIHHYTTPEVFGAIRAAGQSPHHAYAEGNDRLSCVFCIMASRNDLRNGARQHPELYQRYVAMEAHTGYTMHASRIPLVELVADEPQQGLHFGSRAA